MRELRKDIESTLESSKEELDGMDEMKIEEVLMGLKGLKQEEVFSFLGKSNFTPSETEMSSSGLGSYDQLASVDTSEMEQLQLSFNAHFDGLQGIHGHAVTPNSFHVPKFANVERLKVKSEPNTSKAFIDTSKSLSQDISYGWPSVKKEKYEDVQPQQRLLSMWPRYPGSQNYSLADCHVESLREEEIIATNIAEEMISSTNVDEEEFKYTPPNNTYVIQSPVDGVDNLDKPKPIKLLIKRVESEDEVADSPASRVKSKRTRQPSAKRKMDETSAPPKKKRCSKRTPNKTKGKNDVAPTTKPKEESFDELDFPFSNTVHQDDDFVYPSLDLSDDEEGDVYIFNQRDDETWTPKIKMKINDIKTERPTRDRKRNSAVAKCLEAAALKRAESDPLNSTGPKKGVRKSPRKKSSACVAKSRCTSNESFDNLVIIDGDDCTLNDLSSVSSSSVTRPDNTYSLPSTSSAVYSSPSSSSSAYCTRNTFSSPIDSASGYESPVPKASAVRRASTAKSKTPLAKAKRARIVPPKTCKLIQTPPQLPLPPPSPTPPPPGVKPPVTSTQLSAVKRCMKNEVPSSSSSSSCSIAYSAEKKSPSASYITKRGKPKKGMATAKQRLGKILKMHKMFF